jgi:23S rRNA-/tRNA-specific pseudouridylate synthase
VRGVGETSIVPPLGDKPVEVPEVLFRDGLMLIVNKPPGVPVHAGPSGGPSLEDTFDALRFGLPRPPALAHRLDQDTSGCLVLGRHPKALRRLGTLFSEGRVGKTYWAVTRGRPASDRGRIDFPLLKTSSAKKGWRMVVDESGKDGGDGVSRSCGTGRRARLDRVLAPDGPHAPNPGSLPRKPAFRF